MAASLGDIITLLVENHALLWKIRRGLPFMSSPTPTTQAIHMQMFRLRL